MKVVFHGNSIKDKDQALGLKVVSDLISLGFEVYVVEECYQTKTTKLFNDEVVDFAVILGGDGTILKFAREYDLPIYGINLGRVGALAEGELENYYSDLEAISKGTYHVDERNALDCEIYKDGSLVDTIYAFNDFSLYRGESMSMVGIDITVNELLSSPIYADGLIISTASGSSAYNQSAGGPLLLPNSKNFVMTPICPQFTAFSSLVCSPDDVVELTIKSGDAFISVDGAQKLLITDENLILVKESKKVMKLISFRKKGSLYSSIYKIAMSIYKE